MTRAEFIAKLAPMAVEARKQGSPLFASVRLAQNILETGGKIPSWNNLGGYKVGSGIPNAFWKGRVYNGKTWEVYGGQTVNITAAFRAYDSVYDFYRDQDLLFAKSRYVRVVAAQNPDDQCRALYACGYATDPAYASKLISLIDANNLRQYDVIQKESDEMTAEEKAAFTALKDRVVTLENRASQPAPAWAKDAVAAAVKSGIVDAASAEGGSYDFYRVLTVLHRKKLI